MNKELGYEEKERKTPFLGYVLLVAMAAVVFFLGLSALDDLRDVPKKPEALSSCAYPYIAYEWQDAWHNSYRTYTEAPYLLEKAPSQDDCTAFSAIEKKYGTDAVFAESKEMRKELAQLKNDLAIKQGELNSLRQQYGLGLAETITEKKPIIYPAESIQPRLEQLESKVALLQVRVDELEKTLKPSEEKLKALYKELQKEHRVEWRRYDFYVFLLEALFVLPLFLILLKLYFRLHAKNSPYLIIVTFLLIPVSIFIVKMVFVYFWGLFLAKILEVIWNFVQNIKILKSLLTYLGMILSAVLFGGAVYILQKKIFDPKRLALRRLRDYKCPQCNFTLKLADNFCPHCGEEVLKKCEKCGDMRYKDLPYCPSCNDKRS